MQNIYYEQVLVPSLHSEEVLGSFFFLINFGGVPLGGGVVHQSKKQIYLITKKYVRTQDSIYAIDGVQMDGGVVHQFQ